MSGSTAVGTSGTGLTSSTGNSSGASTSGSSSGRSGDAGPVPKVPGCAPAINEFPIPPAADGPRAGAVADPTRITAGPDGNLWFTDPNEWTIGRITPGGTIQEFPVPASDPYGITAGPDGNIWFTDQNGKIGRITVCGAGQ
jgi:streptogramin lyase